MEKHQEPPSEVLMPRVSVKSAKLMQAQYLKSLGQYDEAISLFREVAMEEEQIAAELKRNGNYFRSSINLISAASCWAEVKEYQKALKVSDKVLGIKEITPALRKEVRKLQRTWRAELRGSDVATSKIVTTYLGSLRHAVCFVITAITAFFILIKSSDRLKPETILLDDTWSKFRPLASIRNTVQTNQFSQQLAYSQWAAILFALTILVCAIWIVMLWSKLNFGANEQVGRVK